MNFYVARFRYDIGMSVPHTLWADNAEQAEKKISKGFDEGQITELKVIKRPAEEASIYGHEQPDTRDFVLEHPSVEWRAD